MDSERLKGNKRNRAPQKPPRNSAAERETATKQAHAQLRQKTSNVDADAAVAEVRPVVKDATAPVDAADVQVVLAAAPRAPVSARGPVVARVHGDVAPAGVAVFVPGHSLLARGPK